MGSEGVNKKSLTAGLIVGFMLGGIIGFGAAFSPTDTSKLEREISNLEAQVADLQSEILRLEKLAPLKEKIMELLFKDYSVRIKEYTLQEVREDDELIGKKHERIENWEVFLQRAATTKENWDIVVIWVLAS